MNLHNYFYYFKKAIPEKICDDILKYGKSKQEQLALTGNEQKKILDDKTVKDLKKLRNSNIVWLNDKWIYNAIHPYVHEANRRAGWNFEWDWSESCQFTKYNKNQFYDWHKDSWEHPYDNLNDLNIHNKIRKLSVTVSLSNESEYSGGELEFGLNEENPDKKTKTVILKEIKEKGSLVVFPSFLWHRVRKVTKGTRYSLVIWNLGYPYK
jgi:PKHD-type hydroxylase